MTPKEKAEQIVGKYLLSKVPMLINEANECALIAVNEMIKIAPSMDSFQPGCPLLECSKEYLLQVKSEIESL